jgi:hypothetical protein
MRIDNAIYFSGDFAKHVAELFYYVVPTWSRQTRQLRASHLLWQLRDCHEEYPNKHAVYLRIKRATYDIFNFSESAKIAEVDNIVKYILDVRIKYLDAVRQNYLKFNIVPIEFVLNKVVRIVHEGNVIPYVVMEIDHTLAMYKIVGVEDVYNVKLIFAEDAQHQHSDAILPFDF